MVEEKASEDLARKYIDQALRFMRVHQSKQTKFIYKEAPYQAASFYENLLFALLLLRKKQHEEMLEGKSLLHRLLKFQNTEKTSAEYGLFPSELTDCPFCNDRALPARVAYILEIIVRDFKAILGSELIASIALTQELLRPHVKNTSFPKIEAFYGELLSQQDISLCPPDEMFADPACFGKMVAALDYFPHLSWKNVLLERACLFWDKDAAMYRGPGCAVFHVGKEQACTLFDSWMSLHTGIAITRSWTRESFLELALVRPGHIGEITEQQVFENEKYAVFLSSQGTFAATFQEVKPHLLRGFSPLRFVSGGVSLAWKFPHGSLISFTRQGNKFFGNVQREDWKTSLLFELFAERSPDVQFFLEGNKDSLFNPYQKMALRIGKATLKISLDPMPMDALALLCMGNRSSQLLEQAEEDAFDWVLSCERIRGEDVASFSFSIELE